MALRCVSIGSKTAPGLGVVLAGLLASAADAYPATGWMSDFDLRITFADRTIEGVYSNRQSFTEAYRADGRLDYHEAQRQLSGRWSVVGGTFCTLYDTIATGGCYRVQRVSENCFEFYYAATDEQQAASEPSDRPSWTARAWRTDRPSTCTPAPSV